MGGIVCRQATIALLWLQRSEMDGLFMQVISVCFLFGWDCFPIFQWVFRSMPRRGHLSQRNALDRSRLRQGNRLFSRMGEKFSREDLMTIEAVDIKASRVFNGEIEGNEMPIQRKE